LACGLSLVAVVLLTAGGAARADTEVGSWSRTGSLPEEGPLPPEGRYPGSAVTLADGRVLEYPGEGKDSEIYDPSSGTWTHGPHRLQEVEGQWTLVALAEGGALLLGATPCDTSGPKGEDQCLPSTTVYRWSPGDVEWSPVAPLHEARVRPVAVLLPDGRVLVAGGFGDSCPWSEAHNERYSCLPLASAEIYDPASNEWTPTAPMPQPRSGAVGALLSDGTVLVVGGETREAIRYDPGSGSWSAAGETVSNRTGSLLFALSDDRALTLRTHLSAELYGSPPIRVYDSPPRVGGEPACIPGASSEIFGRAPSAWTASLIAPAGGEDCPSFGGVLLAGGQILLKSDDEPTYYVLDAEQRCWSTTPPPLEAHIEGEMVALDDGGALVFGGYKNGRRWLSTAEIYTPSASTCEAFATGLPSPGLTSDSTQFTGAAIVHRKRLTIAPDGSIDMQMRCPATAGGSCVGQTQIALVTATAARAKASGHAKRLYLGRASFTVATGGTKWVTIHVTDHMHALRAHIRRQHWATIAVTTTGHDNTGQVATTTVSATLRG
jgi:hypothetical protein